MQEATEIREQLVHELKELVHTLDGNHERAMLIVDAFRTETPGYFSTLKEVITTQQPVAARQLVHALKARYGYFGFEKFMNEMAAWEISLDQPFDLAFHTQRFQYFEKWNTIIMTQVNQIEHIIKKQQMEGEKKSSVTDKRILIAEDDEINSMVFELFIQELGGTVIKAADGHEAVRKAIDHQPDFIFMDIHMPYFSGVEAIRFLRAKGIQVPIIALSASTRLQEKQQSMDAGATDFLTKPAKRDIIRQVLMKYLG